ncbi:MAG: hypothetical protein M3461_22175 [Pseudomonadota bacterium]|nr:hypothetical protein [Pseudomonadota bacterium]
MQLRQQPETTAASAVVPRGLCDIADVIPDERRPMVRQIRHHDGPQALFDGASVV